MKSIKFVIILLVSTCVLAPVWAVSGETASSDAITYKVDTRQSTAKWNGKKVTGEHYGSIRIAEGSFDYDGKTITGGTFVIDMTSLTVEDIKDEKGQQRLANHLKNDDFFATDKFPQSRLVITGSTPGKDGQLQVTGDLTIKGITQPVTFPVSVKAKGQTTEATGKITVDRAKYDIKFRSKSFIDAASLGDKMIYDDFTLDVKVVANK